MAYYCIWLKTQFVVIYLVDLDMLLMAISLVWTKYNIEHSVIGCQQIITEM